MVATLTNANVFVNGRSWLGSSTSITLPEIEVIADDFEGIGFFGTFETVSGLEAMRLEVEWLDINEALMRSLLDFTRSVQMQIRGNVEEVNSRSGGNRSYSSVVIMTCRPAMISMGEIAKSEVMTVGSEWMVDRLKQTIGGREVLEIDVTANIYTVGGQDRLRQYRRNLGLEV